MRASLPVMVVRGGTSRGVFIRKEDAIASGLDLDELALRLVGARDMSCTDGLGGGQPTTSKVVLVNIGEDRSDHELDFSVGNLSPGTHVVDWQGTCGNLTAAVPLYAAAAGLITKQNQIVRMRNLSTGRTVHASTPNSSLWGSGEASVRTSYIEPGGATVKTTFPLGAHQNTVCVDGEEIQVTVADITHPYVIVSAKSAFRHSDSSISAGMHESDVTRVQEIRDATAVAMGLVESRSEAALRSPAMPRILVVGNGSGGADLNVWALSMGVPILTIPVSGAMCLAATRSIAGTIPSQLVAGMSKAETSLLGRSGMVYARADVDPDGTVATVSVDRTCRIILEGVARI